MSARQSLYTIAPHAPFLDTLAAKVLDGTLTGDWPRSGPFWLSDITIILPTRRARVALAHAFAIRSGGSTLLPDIRTLGGEPEEEEPFLPPVDAPALPPAVRPLQRRLILSELTRAWADTDFGRQAFGVPPGSAEVLALAESLARLIDDLIIEDVSPERLRTLPVERELAESWQQALRFLDIALQYWPDALASRGLADIATVRNLRLRRQAETAPLLFGNRPVIAAGSTGSIPATAALLAAISALPRGILVLRGLDTTIEEDDYQGLLDKSNSPHGHPQYGLMRVVNALGGTPSAVTELGDGAGLRTRAVRQALAAPDATARWPEQQAALGPADIDAAFGGVALLAAPDENIEARAIALAAHAALLASKSVGIVTPDRNLARRIAAELARFEVRVEDGAGTPLFQSRIGRLVRQMVASAASDFEVVDLMGLLRHPLSRFSLGVTQLARLTDLLDLSVLRQIRPARGLDGLRMAIATNVSGKLHHPPHRLSEAEGRDLDDLLTALGTTLAPLTALVSAGPFTASSLGEVVATTLPLVLGDAEYIGGGVMEDWLADLAREPGHGARLTRQGLDSTLNALMRGFEIRNPVPTRSDIAIWGQLEARLQSPDLLIVAALNEDIWPATADPGPWMSRGMRLAVGLEPPERQQGLAAHDFEMALGNAEVVLAYATRRGTSPAIPSRLVQRIVAFVGKDTAEAMASRGRLFIDQARRLDLADHDPLPARRPAPIPPASVRPRRLSITEIETLFRSPYDLYAKHVLKLSGLDPIGLEPSGRNRGNVVHAVLARFVLDGHSPDDPDAEAILLRIAADEFRQLDAAPERRDIWLRRFSGTARDFLAFERSRPHVVRRFAEIRGDLRIETLDGFRLTGRADRIDVLADGSVALLDFKTGVIPAAKDMKALDAPQLPLAALMVREGGFGGVGALMASELAYIKIGLGPGAFQLKAFTPSAEMNFESTVDAMFLRLQRYVDALLLKDNLPLASRIRPDTSRRYPQDYDHLARVAEWSLSSEEEE